MLRIIAGRYKGRRLKMVPDSRVRPLPAKLRESLFNILQSRIREALVLDGFAGTGSIGIEALSRGASRAVFVEELTQATKIIQANLNKCEAEEYGLIINREFNRAVIDLSKKGLKFDLIFLDPPYRLLAERNPLKVIRKRGILKPEGLLIIRHHRRYSPSREDFKLWRQVDFGDDIISIYTGEVIATPKKDLKNQIQLEKY
ncbi:MAG: 16S rRNA (guanine(966)-N(2))-methyltransferase RsmD [Acidobacteriota bacterium]|nr:16S rRNA (guanine(966)-N(2))-methyltransferase RsmD [Acidobacteriota bacterium]MDW3228913.1 16S rRNA (guanine(966)-N(2))-methyltransferase RsmD [Acidobacteriota bacterium]MDY0231767.1 16S rRNA (guanine(966)-N(2))-methyltransferase RsmD [Candidatus Saccharicenans sp.]